MKTSFLNLESTSVPQWIIFLLDLLICALALYLAFLLRFNFQITEKEVVWIKRSFMLVIPVRIILFLIFRTYADIIRYTSTTDAFRLIIALFLGSLAFVIINLFVYYIIGKSFVVPFSIIIIDFLATAVLLTGYRVFAKLIWLELKNPKKDKTDVIIFGAGESGIITKRALDRDAGTKYKVIAFIDDDEKKTGKKAEGIHIYHTSRLSDILTSHQVAHVIISVQDISPERKNEIVNSALNHNTKVLVVPPVFNWINGELSFKQIKKIKIEELLERNIISLDNIKVGETLRDQTIFVTGAAGSIGSEIVKQILKHHPKNVICIDRSENDLYNLELSLAKFSKNYKIIIGDICDAEKMDYLFKTYQPEISYHAAAYKHVPMMEAHVTEAVKNNVFGTKLIGDLAVKYKCKRFVMISTDKAVNPTSVMGATKRLAEIYIQTLGKNSTTKFIITRFGNVLGSNGSVIPLFRQQIETGGPVTITHPEVSRYFMTIKEACQLVLEAGTMGKGGEIFIFDMGKQIKIIDLAKKMIQLSGLTLGKDIQIVFTGLRPGEKLNEELLNISENTMPSYHKRILIAKVNEYEQNLVSILFEDLEKIMHLNDDEALVKKIKQIIPEYISHNSEFEKFDIAIK